MSIRVPWYTNLLYTDSQVRVRLGLAYIVDQVWSGLVWRVILFLAYVIVSPFRVCCVIVLFVFFVFRMSFHSTLCLLACVRACVHGVGEVVLSLGTRQARAEVERL